MRPLVPLDKSIIFTYLPPLLNLAMKYIQNNWLAKDPTTNHISNSLFLQFSQEIIDRLYRSIIQLRYIKTINKNPSIGTSNFTKAVHSLKMLKKTSP